MAVKISDNDGQGWHGVSYEKWLPTDTTRKCGKCHGTGDYQGGRACSSCAGRGKHNLTLKARIADYSAKFYAAEKAAAAQGLTFCDYCRLFTADTKEQTLEGNFCPCCEPLYYLNAF